MNEICGDFVVVNPYVWLSNACVRFTDRIEDIYTLSGGGVAEGGLRIITHGMASTHTHLGLYPVRSTVAAGLDLDSWVKGRAWRWERFVRGNPEVSYLSSLIAATEMLLSGVTLIADMHFNEELVYRTLSEIGVKADLSVAIMDGGVFDSYEEALEENLRLLKAVQGADVKVRLGPCTPRLLTPEQFREIVTLAKQLDIGIHTHLAEVREDIEWLKSRYSISLKEFVDLVGLRDTDSIVAHAVWAEDVIDLLSSSNITVSHSPRSNILLGDGRAPVRRYLRHGVNVSLGVDVAPTYDLRDELKTYVSLHYPGEGPSDTLEAFRLSTINAYRGLGFGSGELSPGEVADLVVWSVTDPLVDDPLAQVIWGSSRVEEVYVSGRLILKEGRPVSSVDLLRVRERLHEYLREFSRSQP